VWARCNRFFTNIRIHMVSGWKFAWRRAMVSRPPGKTRSTVTAEPGMEMLDGKMIGDVSIRVIVIMRK
jgi:hypothetical protein